MNLRAFSAIGILLLCSETVVAQDIELKFSEDSLNDIVSQLGAPSDGGIYQRTIEIEGYQEECEFFGYLDCPAGNPVGPIGPMGPVGPIGPAGPGGPFGPDFPIVEFPDRIPLFRCRRGTETVISPGFEAISWQWWITDSSFDVKPGGLEFSAVVRYRVGNTWFREDRTVSASMKLNASDQSIEFSIPNFKIPIELDTIVSRTSLIEVDVSRIMSFSIPLTEQSFTVSRLDGTTKTITSRARSASVQYLSNDHIRMLFDVDIE